MVRPPAEQLEDRDLIPAKRRRPLGIALDASLIGRCWGDRNSIEVRLDHGRVNVILPADRPRIPESLRHLVDRPDDVRVRFLFRREASEVAERLRGKDGSGPGTKVLGRDLPPRDLAEVLVDVARVDALATAVVVEVLE
jgi:hypothetical protein